MVSRKNSNIEITEFCVVVVAGAGAIGIAVELIIIIIIIFVIKGNGFYGHEKRPVWENFGSFPLDVFGFRKVQSSA